MPGKRSQLHTTPSSRPETSSPLTVRLLETLFFATTLFSSIVMASFVQFRDLNADVRTSFAVAFQQECSKEMFLPTTCAWRQATLLKRSIRAATISLVRTKE